MNGSFPDRTEIEVRQLAALNAMIAELVPSNRFYAAKLEEAGLTNGPPSLSEYFAKMPFTLKQELVDDQAANPPFGFNLTYPIERYTRFSQTSGTTGTPMRWLDTTESWSWMVDNWVRVFRASNVGPGDRVFFAFSFGPFLGFWTAFQAAERLGCLCIPGGGMSTEGRLGAILDNECTALCCTPTYAIRLGEVAAESGIDESKCKVKSIIAAGEPGCSIPATRERIQSLWPGARAYDHHGMTEVGPVTYECPARERVLHVIEDGYIPEVVDPEAGALVGAGNTGELVLTNLGRVGSPLLRYRTGDIVRTASSQKCACGSHELALEGGILGRTDDMVVVRGVNLYPSAVEEVIRRFPEVAEYRVTVHCEQALREVSVQLEPIVDCSDTRSLSHEVQSALRSAFNLRIPVEAVEARSLPRFELKAKRWVFSKAGDEVV